MGASRPARQLAIKSIASHLAIDFRPTSYNGCTFVRPRGFPRASVDTYVLSLHLESVGVDGHLPRSPIELQMYLGP